MSKNKNKVSTPEVEAQNDEVITTDAPTIDEVSTPEVEALVEEEEVVESDEVEDSVEEVPTRTFVEGQYTVMQNVKHNGKLYKVGDSITLGENSAYVLLAKGIIE